MTFSLVAPKRRPGLAAIIFLFIAISASAQTETNKIRVGVYDSRAIAVAYANSKEYADSMKPVQANFKKAQQMGDAKTMREIQRQMQQAQRRLDEQAYSTGSVAGIMATLKKPLPAVAKEANVEIIISKWELSYQSPNIEVEDVTDKLVALFHTSEQGWKWAREVQSRPPVAADQVPEHGN